MSFASETYIHKTMQRLYGILQGITLDSRIDDSEVIALKEWLASHNSLSDLEPFKSLDSLITDILDDGVIDEEERDMLFNVCSDVESNLGFMTDITQIIQHLHGLIHGILADGKITKEEVLSLEKWLKEYNGYSDWWPLNELRKHVSQILEDGIVDSEEEAFLIEYLAGFVEQRADNQVIHDDEYRTKSYLQCESPIFNSISSICEPDPEILFDNKLFCFTGPAATGKRADLFKIVKELGGVPHKSIKISLDYLVIGAKSSPAWIYSTYGRKIEGVMLKKEKNANCNTQIINEMDFVAAVKAYQPC